jgi:plasmid stability protein
MTSVRQITVRNPSPELLTRLRSLAAERGESVNATILRVLSESLGVDERRRRLERYATWTEADAREFDEALAAQRRIDEDLWR